MWIGMSILVYWIGYVGLQKSEQLQQRIGLRKLRIAELENKQQESPSQQPNTSSFFRIEYYLKTSKPYLNSTFNLNELSQHLDLSSGYVSKLINKNTSIGFNDYINEFRINEAKKMLIDEKYNNYTVVAIGLEAGLNPT